jgi:hypothetical protein
VRGKTEPYCHLSTISTYGKTVISHSFVSLYEDQSQISLTVKFFVVVVVNTTEQASSLYCTILGTSTLLANKEQSNPNQSTNQNQNKEKANKYLFIKQKNKRFGF